MSKKIGIFLLSFVILLVSNLPMTVAAESVSVGGFYNIGTAKNVDIVPTKEGEPANILAIYANDDDQADLIYEYSNGLDVTLSKSTEGQYYAFTLVRGTELPELPSDFLYTRQVMATSNTITCHVAFEPISGNNDLTLFITSDAEGFKTIAIPVSYTVEDMFPLASGVPLLGKLTLSGNKVITATIIGAPSSEHYDIVWLRNGKVIEGENGTTYTTTDLDRDATIKAKLVAKGSVFVGEVLCERGISLASSGGGLGGDMPMYGVMIECGANGTAVASTKNAMEDAKVSVTVKPNDGYVASAVTVSDNKGNAVEVTNENEVYTFVMPKSAVTVTVAFIKAEEVKPDDKPDDVETVFFADVKEDSFYYDAVLWAVTKGITQGISETAFAPEDSCTRAQIITFLWRAAGEPKAENAENVFTDVAKGSYYYDAVLWAVEKGITAGTTETTFSPDAKVDRAQTVTFMYRMAGEPAPVASDAFTDVAPIAYYNNAVNWAVTSGITKGTGVGTFSPADVCTRGQIVTFMYRYLAK